jgi:23S rRNA pseudouridine1911/1915/1917 synthase
MAETRSLRVGAEQVAMRLDRFLDASLTDMTRSQIKRLIDDGAVTLDGAACKPGVKLRGGETISVHLPEPIVPSAQPEPIPLDIMYQDASLIVVNKPAHLVVHPAPGHQGGTLVNALLHHCDDLSGVGGALRPGIVHHLDKDTSGVMVATKNDRTHRALARQFKDRTITRRYRALVYGLVRETRGTIDQPIGRHPVQRKKMSTLSRSGRRAVTHWQVLRRYPQDRLSLLDLSLETGRTHQIRVHMAALNTPIIGDSLYGGSRGLKALTDKDLQQKIAGLNRQFLHAWQLGFDHPERGAMLFQAELPPELMTILDFLDQKYAFSPATLGIERCAGPLDMDSDENCQAS